MFFPLFHLSDGEVMILGYVQEMGLRSISKLDGTTIRGIFVCAIPYDASCHRVLLPLSRFVTIRPKVEDSLDGTTKLAVLEANIR